MTRAAMQEGTNVPDTIRTVMTPNPVTVPAKSTLDDAARAMKNNDIGDVIVLDGDRICGVVTDRDLVVRALAESLEPTSTRISDICSRGVVTVTPADSVDQAVQLMREHALRRLPVVEGKRPVG